MPDCTPPKPPKQVTRRHHPLPDAVAIDSIPIPQAAPPYDHDRPAPDTTTPDGSTPGLRPPITSAPAISSPAQRSPARDPAGHWPSQFAQALAETLAGSRPPSQLAPWTTEQARRRIGQLGPMLATAHRPRVRRVIVTSPAGGVLEMAVIVSLGARVRALAVRLERAQPSATAGPATPAGALGPGELPNSASGWLCTAVEAA